MVEAADNCRAKQGMPAVNAARGGRGGQVADEGTVCLEVPQKVVKMLANAAPGLNGSWVNVQPTAGRVALDLLSLGHGAGNPIHRGGGGVLPLLLRVPHCGVNEQGRSTRSCGNDVHDCLLSQWGIGSTGWPRLEAGPCGDMNFTCWFVVGIPEDAAES